MMRMAGTWRIPAVIAIALILAPATSRAQLVETSIQPAAEEDWSATAGRTSGAGNSVLQVEAGWPGIGFTWLKGLDERSDLVLVGSTHSPGTLRIKEFLTRNGHPFHYIDLDRDPDAQELLDRFHVSAADVPVLISFSNPAGFFFGPQLGGGGEYLIDRNLAVTARFRVGPRFALDSAGSNSQTGFVTLIGLAYNAR